MSALHFVWNTREDYTHMQVVRNKVVPLPISCSLRLERALVPCWADKSAY